MDSNLPYFQDKAYLYLKERITNSTYPPNSRIKALQIASDLGISRTPVKEALGRLEQEGLVRREGKSGYVVQVLSVRDILNLYKVREVLEVEAAREALIYVTPEFTKKLEVILSRAQSLLRRKRYDEFLLTNRDFHNSISAATRNEVLQESLARLNARIWSIGTIVVRRYPPRADEILFENRRILKALAAKKSHDLEQAVRAHIRGGGDAVEKFIERESQNLYINIAS